jgi:hypothetical protein
MCVEIEITSLVLVVRIVKPLKIPENKFLKTKENKIILVHIYEEESCISLIIQIYKIYNLETCLLSSSASMLKE